MKDVAVEVVVAAARAGRVEMLLLRLPGNVWVTPGAAVATTVDKAIIAYANGYVGYLLEHCRFVPYNQMILICKHVGATCNLDAIALLAATSSWMGIEIMSAALMSTRDDALRTVVFLLENAVRYTFSDRHEGWTAHYDVGGYLRTWHDHIMRLAVEQRAPESVVSRIKVLLRTRHDYE